MSEHAAAVAAIVADMLGAEFKASKPEDYDALRAGYVNDLTDAFITYLASGGRAPMNAAGRAVLYAVGGAIEGAFYEADAELTDDDRAWLRDTQTAQREYLPGVFEWIKDGKKADQAAREAASLAGRDIPDDTMTEGAVAGRVDAWAQALDGIRSEAAMRTKGKQMLTWHVGDTEHCDTCRKLDGKRHPAAWYLANDYIPGKAGAAMDCGGYRCQCYLTDKAGDEVTL